MAIALAVGQEQRWGTLKLRQAQRCEYYTTTAAPEIDQPTIKQTPIRYGFVYTNHGHIKEAASSKS